MESTKKFASRREAERGFVSLVKTIAANAYSVTGFKEANLELEYPPFARRSLRPAKPLASRRNF